MAKTRRSRKAAAVADAAAADTSSLSEESHIAIDTPPAAPVSPMHANLDRTPALPHHFDIDRLNNEGSNYQIWSSQMRLVLRNLRLWSIVDGSEPSPHRDDPRFTNWQAREWDAQARIMLSLNTEPYAGVIAATTSKEAWDALRDRYQGTGLQTAALNIAAIFQSRLTDNEPFEPQINALLERWRTLKSHGITLDESIIAIAIIMALPDSYTVLRTILLSQSALPKISPVKNHILTEEQVRSAAAGALTTAFKAQTGRQQKPKANEDHGTSQPKCTFCGRTGHVEEDCRKKKAAITELEAKITGSKGPEPTDAVANLTQIRGSDTSYSSPPIRLFTARLSTNIPRRL